MNKLAKNYIYNLIYQLFVMFVPLITAPYLARILGAKNLGVFSYVSSSASIISTIASLGIYTYGNRLTAYNRDDFKLLNRGFWELMMTKIILGIVGSILYFVYASAGGYFIYFLLYYPWFFAGIIDCSWLFVGVEDMKPTVIKNFSVKLIGVVGIFVFVKTQSDLWKYVLLLSISTVIPNILVYTQIKKYIYKPEIIYNEIPQHLKGAFSLFLPQIASLIYLQMDKVMLEWLTGDTSQISFYEQAEKIVTIPLTVITAISTVIMPRLANEYKNKNSEQVDVLINTVGQFSMMLAIPMMVGIVLIAEKFVPWYLGKEFEPTIIAIIMISPLILTNTLSGLSGSQYFTATNQINVIMKAYITAAACNVITNAVLIPKFAYIGAAIATLLSSVISVGIQYYYFTKQVNIKLMFKVSCKYFIYTFFMAVIIYLTTYKMPVSPITTLIQIVIGIMLYIICLVAFRDKIFMNALKIR